LENKQYSILRGDDGFVTARGVAIVYRSAFQVFATDKILPKHLINSPNVAILKLLLQNTGLHLFILTFYGSGDDASALQSVDLILQYLEQNYQQWNIVIYSDFNLDLRLEKLKLKARWVIIKKFFFSLNLLNRMLEKERQ